MKKNNGIYYTNRHSCFLLQYHMVLVMKYRRPVLTGAVKEYVYANIRDTLERRGCNVLGINGEADHVHILFEMGPDKSVMETANVVKTRTARMTRARFPKEIGKFYWGDRPPFWTDSYFITTVGYASTEAVSSYIKNQGKH